MKNTQKGFIVPLLIAIIAVLAIGGGVYLYTQNKSTSTEQQLIADDQVVSTSTTQTQTSSSQIAGSKTYTNTVYGFSFKYPSNLKVSASCDNNPTSCEGPQYQLLSLDSSSGNYMLLKYSKNISEIVAIHGYDEYDLFHGKIMGANTYKDLADYFLNGPFSGKYSTTTISGNKIGYKIKISVYQYVIFENNGIYMLQTQEPDSSSLIKNILSSFKFTSSAPKTTPTSSVASSIKEIPFVYSGKVGVYKGQITISGVYSATKGSGSSLDNLVCFDVSGPALDFYVGMDNMKRMPDKTVDFCFNNQDEAKKLLGVDDAFWRAHPSAVSVEGLAKVVIKDFTIGAYPAMRGGTDLVQVISVDKNKTIDTAASLIN